MREKGGNSRIQVTGFTLIEIMVAIAVVAISFVSFYKLFSQAVTADSVARFYTVAPLLAQQKMAEISSGVASVGYDGTGNFEKYPEFVWKVRTADVISESLGPAVSEMKQVDVTISANDDARSFSLRAYVFLHKE